MMHRSVPLLLLACVMLPSAIRSEEAEKVVYPGFEVLNVGYSRSAFYDVNINDARAATRASANALMEEASVEGDAEVYIAEESSSLGEMVRHDDIHILSVLCSEYLIELQDSPVTPVFTAVRGEAFAEQYVLLTHREAGRRSVADLRNTVLLTAVDWEASVPMMWLNVLLDDSQLPGTATFFERVTTVKKTIQAVLPVFFGQADACLVPQSVYKTVSELNPQIGADLEVLAASPGYCYGLVCFSDSLGGTLRDQLERSLLSLHETPQGQQLLTVFYVDRLIPFDPTHIESTVDLIRKYERLGAE